MKSDEMKAKEARMRQKLVRCLVTVCENYLANHPDTDCQKLSEMLGHHKTWLYTLRYQAASRYDGEPLAIGPIACLTHIEQMGYNIKIVCTKKEQSHEQNS